MRTPMPVWLMVIALVVSGCVGQPFGQTMHQMRSDINLLDQRVGQLERASLGQASQPTAVPWSTEPQVAPVPPATAGSPEGRGAGGAGPDAGGATREAPPAPMLKPTKREIQQALKGAGFYQGGVDGKIGPQTREAIKEFQRANGLRVDGVVGRQTWERLAPYLDQSGGSVELGATETLK